jgi:hypothetical protein
MVKTSRENAARAKKRHHAGDAFRSDRMKLGSFGLGWLSSSPGSGKILMNCANLSAGSREHEPMFENLSTHAPRDIGGRKISGASGFPHRIVRCFSAPCWRIDHVVSNLV